MRRAWPVTEGREGSFDLAEEALQNALSVAATEQIAAVRHPA